MNNLKLFKPLWWAVHAAAWIFVFWLGHAIHFQAPR